MSMKLAVLALAASAQVGVDSGNLKLQEPSRTITSSTVLVLESDGSNLVEVSYSDSL